MEVTLPQVNVSDGMTAQWKDNIGEHMIRKISVFIGDNQIDVQSGEFMHIFNNCIWNRYEYNDDRC